MRTLSEMFSDVLFFNTPGKNGQQTVNFVGWFCVTVTIITSAMLARNGIYNYFGWNVSVEETILRAKYEEVQKTRRQEDQKIEVAADRLDQELILKWKDAFSDTNQVNHALNAELAELKEELKKAKNGKGINECTVEGALYKHRN